MKNRAFLFIGTALCAFVISGIFFVSFFSSKNYIEPDKSQLISQKVILIPIDSRPPCQDFPKDLGILGNIDVETPPESLMDQNLQPAKKEELLTWLQSKSSEADAIILSTDILLHGGLVASRRISPEQLTPEYQKNWQEKIDALIDQLWLLKKKNPHLKIYVFSIIPRQLVSGEPPASYYEPHLYHYSQYSDKVALFELPKDIAKLADWRSILPDEVLQQYRSLFQRNLELNKRLISESKKGLFDRLIIGQDDAQPFGIPNWYRQWAEEAAKEEGVINQKVFFTGGTDEIAQLLLARFALESSNRSFKVYPYFTDKDAPHRIFPFMREALDTNTFEKIRILGVEIAEAPENADLILAIHGGFPELQTYTWRQSAKQISNWVKAGYPVAIVDVARDFNKPESLLPYLISEQVPLLNLSSYAGWNTASNSIGTALSQGILFGLGSDGNTPSGSLPARRNHQVQFLLARFLDDWAYQKDVQDQKNTWLQMVGTNPYELGYVSEQIASQVHHEMEGQFYQLYRKSFFHIPYRFTTNGETREFGLADANFSLSFPWQRTFEIRLQVDPKWIRKE